MQLPIVTALLLQTGSLVGVGQAGLSGRRGGVTPRQAALSNNDRQPCPDWTGQPALRGGTDRAVLRQAQQPLTNPNAQKGRFAPRRRLLQVVWHSAPP